MWAFRPATAEECAEDNCANNEQEGDRDREDDEVGFSEEVHVDRRRSIEVRDE